MNHIYSSFFLTMEKTELDVPVHSVVSTSSHSVSPTVVDRRFMGSAVAEIKLPFLATRVLRWSGHFCRRPGYDKEGVQMLPSDTRH